MYNIRPVIETHSSYCARLEINTIFTYNDKIAYYIPWKFKNYAFL